MYRATALLLLIPPAVAFAADGTVNFAAGAPVALPSLEATALFKQCSRSTPTPEKILGAPTPDEVAALEVRVTRYIADLSRSGKRVPRAGTYARQYVSFMEGGKRKIYANFFPTSFASLSFRLRAVIVCDGGTQFWGVVYDPERDIVEKLEMNGAA